MSRREQANEEFLAGLKNRTSRAIQQYFFSHGVCVGRSDVRKAMALPEHEQTFASLARSFAQVNESISLLTDIGSLSLPSKEKTMRAVYEIEGRLRERGGCVEGLERALARIEMARNSIPAEPKLWPYTFWGVLCLLAAYFVWPSALVGVMLLGAGFNRHSSYKKRKAEAERALSEANDMFEAVATLELTPRLRLLEQ
jgi:hypothetical protein